MGCVREWRIFLREDYPVRLKSAGLSEFHSAPVMRIKRNMAVVSLRILQDAGIEKLGKTEVLG
jgi:hypothetical protein